MMPRVQPTLSNRSRGAVAVTTLALFVALVPWSLGRAADAAEAPTLSFCQAPFVHPLVVKELMTWISDGGDQVVALNLLDTNDSNRYYGDIHSKPPGKLAPPHPQVFTDVERLEGKGKTTETFSYRYVGLTRSGVHDW